MQLSYVGTFKALKDHTFVSVNGMRYSGLSSSTGKCVWRGYDDLCRSRTACGQDMVTCATAGLFVDRVC